MKARGYLHPDRRGAERLFRVLTEGEETASVAIASNESFSSWTKTFTDPRLCAAIVDRLTFAGQIIETGSTSSDLLTPVTPTRQVNRWCEVLPCRTAEASIRMEVQEFRRRRPWPESCRRS